MQPIYKIKTGLLVCILLFTSHAYSQQTIEFSCGLVTIPFFKSDSSNRFINYYTQYNYVQRNVMYPIQQSQAEFEMRVFHYAGHGCGPYKDIYTMRMYKDSTVLEKTAYIELPTVAAPPRSQLTYTDYDWSGKEFGTYKWVQTMKDTLHECDFLQKLVKYNLFSQKDLIVTADTLANLGISIPERELGVHVESSFQYYLVEVNVNHHSKTFRIEIDNKYSLASHLEPYKSTEEMLDVYLAAFEKQ